jgi:cytochrome P450
MFAKTVVAMAAWTLHRNPDVFPDPEKYDPTRWSDPATARILDKNMMPFGGGSRVCVGMPLAYAELYITIGLFIHRFENIKIYKTTDIDMEIEDYFKSLYLEGRNWVKAVR